MRIVELLPLVEMGQLGKIVKNPDETYSPDVQDKLVYYLKDRGWQQLGSCAFAKVLKHPKANYVLKVASHSKCYKGYVQYALAHQNNPYVPKFLDRKAFVHPRFQDAFAIRMEPLTDIFSHPPDALETLRAIMRVTTFWHMAGDERYLNQMDPTNPTMVRSIIKDAEHFFKKKGYGEQEMAKIPGWFQRVLGDQWLFQLVRDLVLLADKSGCGFDLGVNNIMARGNQLVITDPYPG